jgi:hypothetical protein
LKGIPGLNKPVSLGPPRLGGTTPASPIPGPRNPGSTIPKKGSIKLKQGGSIDGVAKKGKTKAKKFAKGGSIDGCALRGHTRAKRSR